MRNKVVVDFFSLGGIFWECSIIYLFIYLFILRCWNCSTESCQRSPHRSWQWRDFYPLPSRFVCRIRYHWPENSPFSPWNFLLYLWHGPCLVQILSNRSQPSRHLSLLTIYTPEIRGSTRFSFGTSTVCLVYQACVTCHWSPHYVAWESRRWYSVTDVGSDVTSPTNDSSYQDCISDLKSWMTQNKFQLNEDKTEVLLAIPSKFKNLAAKFHLHHWFQYSFIISGPQPRSHSWSNTHLQTAYLKHLQNSLFRTQKNQFNPWLSLCWCHKNTCVFLSSVKAWSLQLSFSWIPKVSPQEILENPKQRSPGNLQVIKTWPCFPTSARTSLAFSPSTNQPQTVFHLFFFCHWHWSSIPCQHSQDLSSFLIASFLFLLRHWSVSNSFRQYKVNWPTYFCTPRPDSL